MICCTSGISSLGFDSNKESVSIGQLIQYSLDGFTRQLAEKKLIVRCSLPDQAPPLLANPVQMRQMLDKMLDNSIKYTPAGWGDYDPGSS
jgi:signal transduction histidine kinase